MLTPQVITSIKRTFSRSKESKKFKDKSVVKGEKGVRGGKIVECSKCKAHIPYYKGQIDHIDPIVPVMIAGKYMSFIMLYTRTFCGEKGLQVICHGCHDIKSRRENKERVQWRRKRKYLVCRSTLGSKIKVIPIIKMKDLDEKWEVMAVYSKRKDADCKAKKLRKI